MGRACLRESGQPEASVAGQTIGPKTMGGLEETTRQVRRALSEERAEDEKTKKVTRTKKKKKKTKKKMEPDE